MIEFLNVILGPKLRMLTLAMFRVRINGRFFRSNVHMFRRYVRLSCFQARPYLATERESQLTTALANQTTGLTNGRATNWAPEVEFSPFRALSLRQMTFRSVAKSA